MDRLGKKSATRTTPLCKGPEAESKLKLWTIRQCKCLKHGRREKEEVRGKTPSTLTPQCRASLHTQAWLLSLTLLLFGCRDPGRAQGSGREGPLPVPQAPSFRGPGSPFPSLSSITQACSTAHGPSSSHPCHDPPPLQLPLKNKLPPGLRAPLDNL